MSTWVLFMVVMMAAILIHALVIASPVILIAWLIGSMTERKANAAKADAMINQAIMREVTGRADD